MDEQMRLQSIYAPSNEVVAREIQGVMIILPVAAGIGDLDDELYSLNETGKAIWNKLDGRRSLESVIRELSTEYQDDEGEIETDVLGLVEELLKRKMVVQISHG